jgi:hypothetical protein
MSGMINLQKSAAVVISNNDRRSHGNEMADVTHARKASENE